MAAFGQLGAGFGCPHQCRPLAASPRDGHTVTALPAAAASTSTNADPVNQNTAVAPSDRTRHPTLSSSPRDAITHRYIALGGFWPLLHVVRTGLVRLLAG